MAKKHDAAATGAAPKKRWYHNFADAYRVAKKTYPWVGWAMAAAALVAILFFSWYTWYTGSWIFGILFGISFALMLPLTVLGPLARRSSYKQIENVPGAVGAVLGQAPRGWIVEQEPVAMNPRTRDLVYRCIGRPGIVLITEGPTNRVNKLVNEQRSKLSRVANTVPVHVINTGTEPGQTKLVNLLSSLRKLKRKLTPDEVDQVAKRLSTVAHMNLGIPKGIDPLRVRPDRKAMRG